MKKLLPVIFLLIGLGAGVGAGVMMGGGKPAEVAEGDQSQGDGKTEDAEHKAEPDAAEDPDLEHDYLRLTKQFVVPLVSQDRVEGLVTVSLSLEATPGNSDAFFAKEPKLRDAFLQVLFDYANMGGFNGAFTRPENLDVLRGALSEVAKREMGDEIHGVLISDIARQDTH
jgi:flagellar protein FliL